MKPETALYRSIKPRLERYLVHLVRIESSVNIGIPDIYYYTPTSEGWLELKQIKQMPLYINTPIRIPFRQGQHAWLTQRFIKNTKTLGFLLVKIDKEVFLFKNNNILEEYTRTSIYKLAEVYGRLNDKKVILKIAKALQNVLN